MIFDIFGGCTSRDLFNFDDACGKVGNYFARSSLVSQYTEVIPSLQNIDINLGSKFQRAMVQGDLQKNFYNYFRNGSRIGDFLILDLLIERLSLIKFQNGLITRTSEYAKIKADLGIVKERFITRDEHAEQFRKIAPILAQDFRRYKKIFLHKSFLRERYISNEGLICNFDNPEKIVATNNFLSQLYNVLENIIPNMQTIHVPEFEAWEGHRWGLTNYHYETEYYHTVNRRLQHYINGQED